MPMLDCDDRIASCISDKPSEPAMGRHASRWAGARRGQNAHSSCTIHEVSDDYAARKRAVSRRLVCSWRTQNTNFSASWISRGEPAVLIRPNEEDCTLLSGSPNLGWLAMLKNSPRNCNLVLSNKLKSLNIVKSMFV